MHTASRTTDIDVIVVGAGVAGLAAAAELRALGRACVVLEATGRIGGRAWTDNPAALGHAPFDRGASWLHEAERNPLVAIAHAHGERVANSESVRTRRMFIGGRLATKDEGSPDRRGVGAPELTSAVPAPPSHPTSALPTPSRRYATIPGSGLSRPGRPG